MRLSPPRHQVSLSGLVVASQPINPATSLDLELLNPECDPRPGVNRYYLFDDSVLLSDSVTLGRSQLQMLPSIDVTTDETESRISMSLPIYDNYLAKTSNLYAIEAAMSTPTPPPKTRWWRQLRKKSKRASLSQHNACSVELARLDAEQAENVVLKKGSRCDKARLLDEILAAWSSEINAARPGYDPVFIDRRHHLQKRLLKLLSHFLERHDTDVEDVYELGREAQEKFWLEESDDVSKKYAYCMRVCRENTTTERKERAQRAARELLPTVMRVAQARALPAEILVRSDFLHTMRASPNSRQKVPPQLLLSSAVGVAGATVGEVEEWNKSVDNGPRNLDLNQVSPLPSLTGPLAHEDGVPSFEEPTVRDESPMFTVLSSLYYRLKMAELTSPKAPAKGISRFASLFRSEPEPAVFYVDTPGSQVEELKAEIETVKREIIESGTREDQARLLDKILTEWSSISGSPRSSKKREREFQEKMIQAQLADLKLTLIPLLVAFTGDETIKDLEDSDDALEEVARQMQEKYWTEECTDVFKQLAYLGRVVTTEKISPERSERLEPMRKFVDGHARTIALHRSRNLV